MGVWDDIDMSNFDGGENESNEKLSKILKRSHNQLVADYDRSEWAKNNLTGLTHTEETKKKLSEAHKGKKMNSEHVNKFHKGRKNTAFKNLINRVSKEDILKSIEVNGNHQRNIINHLDISFHTYKKLCNHYKITPPKKSKQEKSEYVINKQGNPIRVYDCVDGEKGKLLYEFRSVSLCCKELGLHKANMLRNESKGTPYHNMIFEKVSK